MNSLADELTGRGIPQPETGHQSDPRQPDVEEARRLLDTAERHGIALLPELLAVDLCVLGAALQSVFDEPVWRSWLAAERIGLGTGHRERLSPAEDHARSGNLNQIYQYALMPPGQAVHVLARWLHPAGEHGCSVRPRPVVSTFTATAKASR